MSTRSSNTKVANLPKNAVASTTYGEATECSAAKILDEFDPDAVETDDKGKTKNLIEAHDRRMCSLIDIGSGSGKCFVPLSPFCLYMGQTWSGCMPYDLFSFRQFSITSCCKAAIPLHHGCRDRIG